MSLRPRPNGDWKRLDWLHLLVPSLFLVLAVALRIANWGAVAEVQNRVFDSYNRRRPRPYREAPVRIIDIDDESLSRLGQWPWPRALIAQVVRRLKALGASAIAFDIVFAEPDRTSPSRICRDKTIGSLADYDRILAQAIADSPVVIGSVLTEQENYSAPALKASFALAGDDPLPYLSRFNGAVINLPEHEKAASGNGSFNIIPEPDGIIRRIPLLLGLKNQVIPSLAAEALRVAQGAATISVKASGASGETAFGAHTGISKIKIGDFIVPTDAHSRAWVYYSKPDPRRTIPIWRILENDFDPKQVEGCITFLGTSASGLKDQRATPLNPVTPGVEVHAQIAEQILLKEFLQRPDWASGAETLFLFIFGAALILFFKRLGAAGGAVVALLAAVSAFVLSWQAFLRWKWLIDPLFPALTVLLIYLSSSLISYLRSEGDRRRVRNAFGRYMSPVLVEQLAAHPEKLKLGGEMKRMTFHFCDIEAFTGMSEWYDPQGLTIFLNRFLTPMTEIILAHKGSIDKYVGDCIVAYWNAPLDDPEHAKNACLAVLEMHARLKTLNAELQLEAEAAGRKFLPLKIRTGLNTGPCIVGNMGSNQRFDYSILGDDVNLASRLEGANKFFGTYIMASEFTLEEARHCVEARELGRVRVLGKSTPIKVFNLLSKKGELSADWRGVLPHYEKGLALFNSRQFEQAALSFQEVIKILPKDGPSNVYLNVSRDYSAIPPPEDWTGVFNLTAK